MLPQREFPTRSQTPHPLGRFEIAHPGARPELPLILPRDGHLGGAIRAWLADDAWKPPLSAVRRTCRGVPRATSRKHREPGLPEICVERQCLTDSEVLHQYERGAIREGPPLILAAHEKLPGGLEDGRFDSQDPEIPRLQDRPPARNREGMALRPNREGRDRLVKHVIAEHEPKRFPGTVSLLLSETNGLFMVPITAIEPRHKEARIDESELRHLSAPVEEAVQGSRVRRAGVEHGRGIVEWISGEIWGLGREGLRQQRTVPKGELRQTGDGLPLGDASTRGSLEHLF